MPPPLNSERAPSRATIVRRQSQDDPYRVGSPHVIIMRRCTVSSGYFARPAATVMAQPMKNDARNDFWTSRGKSSFALS